MAEKLNFLYYDKSAGIVEKIDSTKFLGLNSPDTARIDLYLFAMALGKGMGSKLSKKDSFVRGEYLERKHEATPLIASLSIGTITNYNELDEIVKTNQIYDEADECANTGFRIIESMIEDQSAENIELRLTADLDKIYKLNIESFRDNKR